MKWNWNDTGPDRVPVLWFNVCVCRYVKVWVEINSRRIILEQSTPQKEYHRVVQFNGF